MKIPSPVQRRHSRIVIIPLIDIMFFLLASFMMISLQMDRSQNLKVNLPSATQARHDFKPDMINVTVDKAGRIWFEKQPISLAALNRVLDSRFRLDPGAPVYISGDRDTLQGAMVEVLQAARAAGFQKVAFTVDGIKPTEGK